MRRKLRFGEILVAEGIITEEQRDRALEIQKQNGRRIGSVLIEMGVITEENVIAVLGKQLGIPYIHLSNYLIDPAIDKIIPENMCRRHRLIPIHKVENKLTVAMEDPLNILAIDDIQFLTGLIIKPVIATPKDINEALNDMFDNKCRQCGEMKKSIFLKCPRCGIDYKIRKKL